MPAMYWAASDLLGMIPDLIAAGTALPPPSELRNTVGRLHSTMMDRARSAGILPEDVAEAQYAIVALVDELLARVNGWKGHTEWRTMPLQLVRFNENTAGENFFRRLAILERQPHRVHVLQIYFLCMAVGFQGRYAVAGGDGLAQTFERVGARVAHASGPEAISPNGEPRERRGVLAAEAPLVRIGLAAFGLALLLFLGLRLALGVQVRGATKPMQAYATTARTASASRK